MAAHLTVHESAQTEIYYPRPLDGKARLDLESEIVRLIKSSPIGDVFIAMHTPSLVLLFASATDQKSFYERMDGLSRYSLDHIFSHKSAETMIVWERKTPPQKPISIPSPA